VKILHLTDRWITGGGQEHIYRICQGLPAHDFVVMAAHDGPARKRFAAQENVDARIGKATPRQVSALGPDLIHFHHMRTLLQWFSRFPFPTGIPVVATVHGLHVRRYKYIHTPTSRLQSLARRILEKRLLGCVHRVVAVSGEDKSFLEERYRLRNVVTIYNGIPVPSDMEMQPPAEVPRLVRPAGGLAALVPARFDFQKGHDILIRALAHPLLERNRERIVFTLAGEGPLRRDMQRMARQYGVEANLRFLGDCSHDGVMSMMQACDLVVLPSRWEGLPIAVLEAGMRGCAVLASDACGNREILENGRGILFHNTNPESLAGQLTRILEDSTVLETLGADLREHVMREYSLERMLSRIERLYADCVTR